MDVLGHLSLLDAGEIKNFKPARVAADPSLVGLAEAVAWYNTTEKVYKFFDGTEVLQFAVGGDLDEYLRRDGTLPMTGVLTLSSNDQSGADDTAAVSKGHVDTVAATKEDVITGAATTITSADLSADVALVSDASGKVSESTTTSAQIGYLGTVTSNVQDQIDSKQDDLGYIPLDKAGDGMLGQLAMNGNAIVGLPAAVDATSPIRKGEYDADRAGFNWKQDVMGVQVDATLDPGATPTDGDAYIITDAAALHANFGTIDTDFAGDTVTLEDNDIVTYDADLGAFIISFDYSADPKADGAMAYNSVDTNNWRIVAGAWAPFYGLDSFVAGIGLVKNGTTFDVNLGAGISELPTDEVGLDLKPDGGLALVDPTTGEDSVASNAVVGVKLNGGSLKVGAAGVAINEAGVGSAHIATDALGNGLQGGEGVALNVKAKADAGIIVDADGVSIDTAFTDNLYVNVDGDTLTGELHGIDGTTDTGFMTKLYIDTADQANAQAVADLATRMEASKVVYDGTAAAAITHTITHNLNDQFVQVSVLNEANRQVIAGEVECTDANTVTVSFETAQKCRVVITGIKTPAE